MISLRHRPARPPSRWRRPLVLALTVTVLAVGLMAGVVAVSLARSETCSGSAPLPTPPATGRVATTGVIGHPFAVAVTPDGQAAFASLGAWWPGDPNGLQVFRRGPDGLRPVAIIPLHSAAGGLAVTPDGRLLLAALDDRVQVLDATRAAAGDLGAVLGAVATSPGAGTRDLAIAGDRYVLAADRSAGRVTVLDLPRIAAGDYGPSAQLGAVDVDLRPGGLAVSPDGRYAFVVSEVQRPVLSLAPTDAAYGLLAGLGVLRRAGTLAVIDLSRVEVNPLGAVRARVSAGCSPAQVAISPDGGTAWVTARQSNELLAYRVDRLLAEGPPPAPAARVRLAAAPAAIRLVDGGRYALVAHAGDARRVSVIDTTAALVGRPAVRSELPVGDGASEIAVSADHRVAYVANNGSSTLTAIDLTALR